VFHIYSFSTSRSDSLFVFYIYSFSSSRVLIFCLCFISIPSALHGFWFSVCVLYLFLQHFTGSDSLVVFYTENQNPWRADGIDIKHKQRIWTREEKQLFDLRVKRQILWFYKIFFFITVCFILTTSVLHGFWLWLCFILITSVLHGFWLSGCVLYWSHQSFTGSDSLVRFYIHHISPFRILTLCLSCLNCLIQKAIKLDIEYKWRIRTFEGLMEYI
jgi:hypothetical protein